MRNWIVLFHDEFELEFKQMSEALQNELLAHALLLQELAPTLDAPG